ncbi:MAG: TIGR03621 family F420-dependent LLM class oxidoreductase [Actinomycetota bacterium]|nr:TIGR03621 family F420-dependent LLM class oxidoreductase [Actinomycetota bacterium]
MAPFRFGVHTSGPPSMATWRDQARRAEALGYSSLSLVDHLDAQLAPLVALTVAAEATTTLHVGTLVLNNDLRNPVVLARELATLGLAAEGRLEVGLGAGWRRSDYAATGIAYDDPAVRVGRLAESVALMRALWHTGTASLDGTHYRVDGATCAPRPALPPRLVVGGGSRRVLSLAATQADTVGVNTPLGTGSVGDDVEQRATLDHYDRCLAWIRQAAGDRFPALELQIAPFAVMVVDQPRAARRAAALLGFRGDHALELPAVLVGTVDDCCERLLERRARWGFSYVVVPAQAMEPFAPVVERLAGT